MEEINIKVHGQVHGVGFRYYTEIKARELGLTGFVRNLPDGTVEIVAQGPKEDLEELNEWAKTSPSYSRVERVDTKWCSTEQKYSDFSIL